MIKEANVGHGKIKMDKIVRRIELPCVRHSRSLYRGRVVCGVVPMLIERKSDEEAKKKGKKELVGKRGSSGSRRRLKPTVELQITRQRTQNDVSS
jgi:hypothetical protein